MKAFVIIFWCLAFIVFYTYIGYGILLWILVKIKELIKGRKPVPSDEALDSDPEVTLLIAAYNEEACISEKMANCLALKYPEDKLKIVWVTDGSTDGTVEALDKYPEARVLHSPVRAGKTAAITRAMEFISSPIVVMTDANTELNPEAIIRIVRRFDDPRTGCVSGEKRVRQEGRNAADTEGAYWKYESFLKNLDDRLYSAQGAAGELFAIRRELWEPMPTDTLLDDMVCSLGTVRKGYRIAYCKDAWASEKPSADISEERKRKKRISAGGFQTIWRMRDIMNPFKNTVMAFQFISHRVLRWAVTPTCLMLMLPVNIAILACGNAPFYVFTLICQIAFYLLAAYGWWSDRNGRHNASFIPYYFLFMNLNTYAGIGYLISRRGSRSGAWEKAKRA